MSGGGSSSGVWCANGEIVRVLVSLLSRTVDPLANHVEIYNQMEGLRTQLGGEGDFECYLVFLLCSGGAGGENQPTEVEVAQAAGLLLKQSIRMRFAQIAPNHKSQIKAALTDLFLKTDEQSGFAYKNKAVQNTLGTVITTIVGFEGLARWPQLMSKIVTQLQTQQQQAPANNAQTQEQRVQLLQLQETLDLLYKVLEEHAENAAVCQELAELCSQFNLGNLLVQKTCLANTLVRVTSLKCVYHLLQILYLSDRYSSPANTHVLEQQQLAQNTLNQLLVLTSSAEPEIKASVCTGFVQLMEVEAQLLQPHLEGLVKYMLVMSQDPDRGVALEATGFWSCYIETIEYYSMEADTRMSRHCEYWLQMALGDLIKVLTHNMKYQTDDEDFIEADATWDQIKMNQFQQQQAFQGADLKPFLLKNSTRMGLGEREDEEEEADVVESWTLRKSSAGTLDHLAVHFEDNLLPLLLPLVTASLASPDWLVRESAILALGAVIPGCPGLEEHTLEVVKFVLPQIQDPKLAAAAGGGGSAVQENHPLLISISCWTLSRFAGSVVKLTNDKGEAGREMYDQMHQSLLLQMRSLHPKVLQAACGAIGTCVQDLPTPFLLQVLDPTVDALFHGINTYTGKNLILLYDLIVTLCEAVNASEVPQILREEKYLGQILVPLLEKLFSTKHFEVLFLNLVQSLAVIVTSFGDLILPFVEKTVQFCTQVLAVQLQLKASENNNQSNQNKNQQQQQQVAVGPGMKYDDKCIVVVLGLLGGLVETLGSHFPHQLLTVEFLRILCGWFRDESPDVKQAAFSFFGSLLKSSPQHVQPIVENAVQAGLASLDIQDPTDMDEVSSANNACWCIMQVIVTFPNCLGATREETANTVVGLVAKCTPFLQRTSGFPRVLLENACVLIGSIGMIHPQALAPYLDQFFWAWAVALASLCDSLEKEKAFVGLCHMLSCNTQVGLKYFPQVCNAVASWYQIKNQDLREMISQVLHQYKQSFVQSGMWEQMIQNKILPATSAKLNKEYQI
jgi:transportin-1